MLDGAHYGIAEGRLYRVGLLDVLLKLWLYMVSYDAERRGNDDRRTTASNDGSADIAIQLNERLMF